MRDPARIERIVEVLRGAWERNPDQRLAQLVLNACLAAKQEGDPFYVEDHDLEAGLWKLMAPSKDVAA